MRTMALRGPDRHGARTPASCNRGCGSSGFEQTGLGEVCRMGETSCPADYHSDAGTTLGSRAEFFDPSIVE